MQTRLLIVMVSFLSAIPAAVFSQENYPCPRGANWIFRPEFSDEFNNASLDAQKWDANNPTWEGRQPAKFLKENVSVSEGFLKLKADVVPEGFYSPNDLENGYHSFSTAAVKSKQTVLYGYFEIRSKPMNSTASSSFWFYDSTPTHWTEIDVFEMSGKHPVHGNIYHTNVHVMKTPEITQHLSDGNTWKTPFHAADDFHLYALQWTKEYIKWYVDNQCVRTTENKYWHQPLKINFDSETMPDWFGLPDPQDLPSTFQIDYIRCWQQQPE